MKPPRSVVPPGQNVRANLVLVTVAAVSRVPLEQILGVSREGAVVVARQVAAWWLRNAVGLTLTRVAHELGMLDHNTVIHACRRVDDSLARDDGDRAWLVVEVLGKLAGDAPARVPTVSHSTFAPMGVG